MVSMRKPQSGAPGEVQRIARQLARSLDVNGVYWGIRSRDGQWTDEPCISVEVYKKHPRRRLPQDRLLPTRIDGYRIDVLEGGRAMAAALSYRTPMYAEGHSASTITCLRVDAAGTCLGLVSGHGTLPVVGGALQFAYDHNHHEPAPIAARGGNSLHQGLLRLGKLSSRVDFALAVFSPTQVNAGHGLNGSSARTDPLTAGDVVQHYSPVDGMRHEGIIDVGLSDHVVGLGRGQTVKFSRLIRVRGKYMPSFGALGDSGSLVVDAAGRAIGTIVAVDPLSALTYVLPLYGLYHDFPDVFSAFFD